MASAHLDSLNTRHAQLDGQIASEMRRPQPDTALIADLKKRKLRLKEEMQRA